MASSIPADHGDHQQDRMQGAIRKLPELTRHEGADAAV